MAMQRFVCCLEFVRRCHGHDQVLLGTSVSLPPCDLAHSVTVYPCRYVVCRRLVSR
jgi:hypothetical protein